MQVRGISPGDIERDRDWRCETLCVPELREMPEKPGGGTDGMSAGAWEQAALCGGTYIMTLGGEDKLKRRARVGQTACVIDVRRFVAVAWQRQQLVRVR
jgi:hypothetical protein